MPTVTDVQTEIEERLRLHAEALSRRDTDAALQLFAPNAIMRPPNTDTLRGTTALREFFERTFASMTLREGRFFTEELYLYDLLAFHYGTYEFRTGDGAEGILDKGGFAIVWRRQRDGCWRYHRGMLNSSLPGRFPVERMDE
jgi:ketosteroid isomerase-like protein